MTGSDAELLSVYGIRAAVEIRRESRVAARHVRRPGLGTKSQRLTQINTFRRDLR
jgi:hypothetical protein